MKSARLSLLMEPDEKRRIEAAAAAEGLSVGEFLRRAAAAYAPREARPGENRGGEDMADEREVRALVAELAGMVDRMDARLDARLAELAALRAEMSCPARQAPEAGAWPFPL